MKISIIVPVYNVEKYLPTCIDSILSQTLKDFELILVDDGSTDSSPKICDDYAQKDSRVVVIHKPNGGVSSARNAGLDVVRGEYIGFVDSDDFIHPLMYEFLLHYLENTQADIAQCGLTHFREDEGPFDSSYVPVHTSAMVLQREEMLTEFADKKRIFLSTIWTKLYRKRIFDNIRFPLGVYMEDGAIQLATIDAAKSVVVFPTALYGYRVRSGSLTHARYTPHSFQAVTNMLENALFFRRNGIQKQEYLSLEQYANHYCRHKLAVYQAFPEYKKAFNSVERRYRKYFFRVISNPCICKMKKLMLILLFVSPKLAYRLCLSFFPECIHESIEKCTLI